MPTTISVIVPLYNEEENLAVLHKRLANLAESNPDFSWEFILVDDGSTDHSFEVLKRLVEQDNRIRTLRFSRNFGSHQALMAGLPEATGDVAVNLAADLQDPPELIPEMMQALKEKGADIVWAVRRTRKESVFYRLVSRIFYFLMRHLALKETPSSGTDICLINRKVIDTIVPMQEKNISLFSLILWSGFNQTSIEYDRSVRRSGKSKWTFSKRSKLVIDSIASFSYKPIRLISVSGVLISTTGFLYALVIIVNALFDKTLPEGWPALMVIVLVLSGFQLLMLGIVAEYLWRIFSEVQRRPPFIISERAGFPSSPSGIEKER
jgi:glycosyltransferase involved in cell wall biosynthesis